jgi:hypothetical protein
MLEEEKAPALIEDTFPKAEGRYEISVHDGNEAIHMVTGEIVRASEYHKQFLPRIKIKYSVELGELILQKLSEQRRISFQAVSRLSGMPSASQMSRWLDEHPEFGEGFEYLLKARAIEALSKIEEIAVGDYGKDEAPSVKLNLEASKFLVERFDKKRFGSFQPKEDSGVVINITSGVTRDLNDERDVSEVIEMIRESHEE